MQGRSAPVPQGHLFHCVAIRPPSPRAGVFRAPARVPFFWCQKKDTKENHSDLRSKNPLARGDTSLADDPTSRPRQFPGFSPVQRTVPRSLSATASLPLPGATVGPYSSIVSGCRGRRPLQPSAVVPSVGADVYVRPPRPQARNPFAFPLRGRCPAGADEVSLRGGRSPTWQSVSFL